MYYDIDINRDNLKLNYFYIYNFHVTREFNRIGVL